MILKDDGAVFWMPVYIPFPGKMCSFWIWFVIVVPCILQTSQASGVFDIQVKPMEKISATVDSSGGCCKNAMGECATQCSVHYRICLKHFQTNITPEPPCTFGYVEIPPAEDEKGGDSASLDKFISIPFPFRFKWPETFSVIIEAWHQPQPSKTDTPVDDANRPTKGDQLLAQFTAHHALRAGANWTEISVAASSVGPLTYAYRIQCDEHYFGMGCEDFCQARNDYNGHFACSSTGARICHSGWTGAYCEIPICESGCPEPNGKCVGPNECRCRIGWQGRDCSECIRYPGCLKGTCQQPFQCNCDEGWGGLFCSLDLNYCTHHHPCLNGGTCTNTGQGSYTCGCPEGFTGHNCELRKDQCEVERCQNGGTCRSVSPGNFTCECPLGYTGRNCELKTKTCADSPCENTATCRDDLRTGTYTCNCKPGYVGKNCEIDRDDCDRNPCKNGGSCTDLINSFFCTCPPGFGGATCQSKTTSPSITDNCSITPCLNAGTCTYNLHGYTCVCPRGFHGPLCQDSIFEKCSDSPCQNGASCEDLRDGDFVCHCPQGFAGKFCDAHDAVNSIEKVSVSGSTLRLQQPNQPGITSTDLYWGIGVGIVVVLGIIGIFMTYCFIWRRKRVEQQKQRSSPVAELNFNMNNFHKTYQIPRVAREWKPVLPTVTIHNEPEEEYYKVLPKRNNACPPSYNTGSSGAPVENFQRRTAAAEEIYVKPMADPPPYHAHHNYRRSYAGTNRSSLPVASFSDYELSENLRQEYAVC